MQDLDNFADTQASQDEIVKLTKKTTDQDKKLKELRKTSKDITEENIELRKTLGLLENSTKSISPPKWAKKNKKTSRMEAVPISIWSDTHFDEVVRQSELQGVNSYNRKIATMRLQTLAEKMCYTAEHLVGEFDFPGAVIFMLGDMISGEGLHHELDVTNDASVMETLVYWSDQLAAAIDLVATHFGSLYIVGIPGNHGRITKKMPFKKRVHTNYDWLLYKMLERHSVNDDRITWHIPDAISEVVEIAGWPYLLEHGCEFRGGSGIAGLWSPIMLGIHKRYQRQLEIGKPFNTLCIGHFHKYTPGGDKFILNGCFTGDTEITTPEGPVTITNIQAGDTVLSTDGTWQTVSHKFEKQSDNGLVLLKVRGLPNMLEVTPNHHIKAIKGETSHRSQIAKKWTSHQGGADRPQWIPADYISPGDWVHIPRPKEGNFEPITEELAWVYGLFVAEGFTVVDGGATKQHNKIELCMHRDEWDVLCTAKGILDKHFAEEGIDVKGRMWQRKNRNTSHLHYHKRGIPQKWRELFGHTALNKKLPVEFMQYSPRLQHALLKGWIDGDGHYGESISATTISKQLAWQMFYLTLRCGLNPSMAYLLPGGKKKDGAPGRRHTSWTVHFNQGQETKVIDGELYYRVACRFRNDRVVPVYDLEVTGNHTYTAGYVGVHNSMKGGDEFSFGLALGVEPATQAFWLSTQDYGPVMHLPLRCTAKGEKRHWQ